MCQLLRHLGVYCAGTIRRKTYFSQKKTPAGRGAIDNIVVGNMIQMKNGEWKYDAVWRNMTLKWLKQQVQCFKALHKKLVGI